MELFGKKRSFPLTASILIGGFVYLYLNLFYLPAIPIHFLPGDATTFLFNARQMQRGQVIYRDFFELTLPATEVVYLVLFKIFGDRAWIPNVMLIVLGLCLVYLMIVISRKVISGKAAYLPAVLFLVVPFRSQLDPTHHWFSTLFVMAALALLIENITALRLVGAGALCGAAMCFTQTSGLPAVLGLALFLLWAATTHRISWVNFRRAQLYIWSSFSIVVVLFNAYFVIQAGLRTFLYDTIVFNLRYYSSEIVNSFGAYMIDAPAFRPWYRAPALAIWFSVYLLVPLIYILFFVRYWDEKEDRPSEPWDRLVLIAITGTMLFLGVAASPSWLRLCTVAAPGVVLFVWFVNSPGRFRSLRTTAVWVIVICVALGEWRERELGWRKQIKLPIGRVMVFDPVQYEEIKFLLDRTKPGDYFFGNNEFNYLLDLRDPSPIPYVTSSDYTRPEQVRETIQGLESHPVKYIFWSSDLDMPPEVAHSTNHLAPLRAYLLSHYQLVKSIEGDDFCRTFWEKRKVPVPVPSAGPIGALPQARLPEWSPAPLLPLTPWPGFVRLATSSAPASSADIDRRDPDRGTRSGDLRAAGDS